MEQESKINFEKSVIAEPKMQEFIKNREISPEDFKIIEKLANFDKNLLIIELHNMFNMNKEKSVLELERLAEFTDDEEKRELYETALSFVRKYDWSVSWNLIRLLEDR